MRNMYVHFVDCYFYINFLCNTYTHKPKNPPASNGVIGNFKAWNITLEYGLIGYNWGFDLFSCAVDIFGDSLLVPYQKIIEIMVCILIHVEWLSIFIKFFWIKKKYLWLLYNHILVHFNQFQVQINHVQEIELVSEFCFDKQKNLTYQYI